MFRRAKLHSLDSAGWFPPLQVGRQAPGGFARKLESNNNNNNNNNNKKEKKKKNDDNHNNNTNIITTILASAVLISLS